MPLAEMLGRDEQVGELDGHPGVDDRAVGDDLAVERRDQRPMVGDEWRTYGPTMSKRSTGPSLPWAARIRRIAGRSSSVAARIVGEPAIRRRLRRAAPGRNAP